jgi:trehalose/maltose transport system permease protein
MTSPTTSPVDTQRVGLPLATRPSIYLLSAFMVLIGIGAIGLLLLAVSQDTGIQSALNWVPAADDSLPPSIILAFLERFGLIMPGLIIFLGMAAVVLGVQLLRGHIVTARWTQMTLTWLAVGLVLVLALTAFNSYRAATAPDTTFNLAEMLPRFGLVIAVLLASVASVLWLNRNTEGAFHGDDLLLARESRLAWNLLIPTLAIVILVAARPLEQTFIRSLTDKRFAGGEVPQFVGLENYTNLLGFRLDVVPCRLDEGTGGCSIRDNGAVRWESIDRDLLRAGFRTVWNISLPFSADRSLAISGSDDDFLGAVNTTLVFAVVSVALELLIGLFMAMVVNSSFKGRGFMRAVMLVPWAIPTVISARLWELILKDTSAGIVNKVFMDLGLIGAPQAWLSTATLQVPTAIIVDVWKTAPFMALLLLAGLQTIPKDLYEAASVDGANPVRRFFSITLPLLRPAIAVALVFRTLDALRVFDLFNVLFGRQQLSMATYNYETLVNNQLDGYASAVSVIIFIAISIFAFAYVRMLNVEFDR